MPKLIRGIGRQSWWPGLSARARRSEACKGLPGAARAGGLCNAPDVGQISKGHLVRREAIRRRKIGRIEIVLAGNPDQGEQGIAAGIGQGGA